MLKVCDINRRFNQLATGCNYAPFKTSGALCRDTVTWPNRRGRFSVGTTAGSRMAANRSLIAPKTAYKQNADGLFVDVSVLADSN